MASRKAAGAAAERSANDARMCDQLGGQIDIIAIPTPSEIQAAYIASRFGLAADRARLTASLAFGEAQHG